ncbi:hypothetical protein ACIP5Y_00900 [Nocardia sp. NPDC088792]|uniref:hypothetical protein n=1 Tax=Nocardia sp. NPDC088792 TaxID=3364332 RepID=UPI00380E8286
MSSTASGNPGPLSDDERDQLSQAIVATAPAQEILSIVLGSELDIRELGDLPPDADIKDSDKPEVSQLLAAVDRLFADPAGQANFRDLLATPEWAEAARHGFVPADATIHDVVLLLMESPRYFPDDE